MRIVNGETVSAPEWAGERPSGVAEEFIQGSRVALLHGFERGDVYRNGQNSWSPTGWRGLADAPLRVANPERRVTADDPVWDDPVRHHSSWLIGLSDGKEALLVGALEAETPRLHADLDVVSAWTERGDRGLWVVLRGPELDAFERYRHLLEARYGSRDRDPGTVWSSWYSFYENISHAALVEALPGIQALGVDTLQIDDGWQRIVGDWVPNDKFANGMAGTADLIREAGLRPGLWVAPLIVLPQSEAFRRHQDLLLRDASGFPVVAGTNWASPYYTFDFTRPEAMELLQELIRTVVGWGFTYLKLDFLQAGAAPGARRGGIGREAAYREAITAIRDAAGPEAYLLGSGAPIFPSLGVLDAVRTGPDVAPMWTNYATEDPTDPTALNALRNAVERLWLRHLIGLDPDVIFGRRRRNLLTDDQIQLLQDCAVLSGFRALSDPPSWLEPDECEQLRRFLAPLPVTSRLGRYEFEVGGRRVDFGPALASEPSPYAL